jgi:hypothetical protein
MVDSDECGAIFLQVGSWVWAYDITPEKSTVTKPERRSRPNEVCNANNEKTKTYMSKFYSKTIGRNMGVVLRNSCAIYSHSKEKSNQINLSLPGIEL